MSRGNALDTIRRETLAALAPPPSMTVTEWADAYRFLSPESAAEPGKFHSARAPYMTEPMDAITDADVHTLVLMWASQLGKTEILKNALGRIIHIDPGPTLFVLPTIEDARKVSRQRITPMIRDTPALRGHVRTGRIKESANTTLMKTFAGGHLTLAGSNSPSGLAAMPIRTLIGDEMDRWEDEIGDEGDPWDIARRRTATFWDRKHIAASSPTVKNVPGVAVPGASRIERLFLEGDRREFFIPCPFCAHEFVLRWELIRWPHGEPERARAICPSCERAIEHSAKPAMLAAGRWKPMRPESEGPAAPGVRSYRLSALYSPWVRWGSLATDWRAAQRGGHATQKVFINTVLAECWVEPTEQLDPNVLILRREKYEPEVPDGVCCLTGAVDVQDSRLEYRVDGWGVGEEAWLAIDVGVIPGDPARPEVWADLAQVLRREYQHPCGAKLPILCVCIDSGGHRTDFVYDFVRKSDQRRLYATKGVDGAQPWGLVSPPSPKRSGASARPVDLRFIAVDTCKSLLASALRETVKGPGYLHLPLREDVGEEFCAQLTSEKPVTRFERGVATITWKKTRPRNEQLDLWSLSLAALRLLRPRFEDMAAVLAAFTPEVHTAAPAAATTPTRWMTHSRYLGGA